MLGHSAGLLPSRDGAVETIPRMNRGKFLYLFDLRLCVTDAWIANRGCLAIYQRPSSPQHDEVADRVAHNTAKENIRWEVRQVGETRERQERRSTIAHPRHPPVAPILFRDHRGYRECRRGMAGRKAAAICERALV